MVNLKKSILFSIGDMPPPLNILIYMYIMFIKNVFVITFVTFIAFTIHDE
jgi:hypothetical protein